MAPTARTCSLLRLSRLSRLPRLSSSLKLGPKRHFHFPHRQPGNLAIGGVVRRGNCSLFNSSTQLFRRDPAAAIRHFQALLGHCRIPTAKPDVFPDIPANLQCLVDSLQNVRACGTVEPQACGSCLYPSIIGCYSNQ
jgi:hypothetical protein